jgi:hypothetical protein
MNEPKYIIEFSNNVFVQLWEMGNRKCYVSFSANTPNAQKYLFNDNIDRVYKIAKKSFSWETSYEKLTEWLALTSKP